MDPITDGHTLIIPKKNIRDIHDIDEESSLHVMRAAKILAGVIEKTFEFDGMEIRSVSGAFQDVPHFHLHVFGRNKNNDIAITYPSSVQSDPEYLSINAEKMKSKLKYRIIENSGFPFLPTKVPNKQLKKDLLEAKKGKGLKTYKNKKALFDDLDDL